MCQTCQTVAYRNSLPASSAAETRPASSVSAAVRGPRVFRLGRYVSLVRTAAETVRPSSVSAAALAAEIEATADRFTRGACERCAQSHFSAEYLRANYAGDDVCETCADRFYAECEECAAELNRTDTRTAADDSTHCEACFDETFTECYDCNDQLRREDARSGSDSEDYCDDCWCERFDVCEDCNATVDRDDSHWTCDETTVCDRCYRNNYSTCVDCGECCRDDSSYSYRDGRICDSCYGEGYYTCDSCGDIVHSDNVNCRDSGVYCDGCDEDESNWNPGRRITGGTFDKVGSPVTFGVELETASCDGYESLNGRTPFGAKEDGSISGKEFVSPVLSGNAGLKAIDDFCDDAEYFSVDEKCGFHAHFGIAGFSLEQRKNIALAYYLTQSVWQSFVAKSRRSNTYCGPVSFNMGDIAAISSESAWDRFCGGRNRYCWANFAAYGEHGTVEIRLHTATLNSVKICNWIKAHTRFISAVADMSEAQIVELFRESSQASFASLATIWGAELAAYYQERARKFGTRYTIAQLESAAA